MFNFHLRMRSVQPRSTKTNVETQSLGYLCLFALSDQLISVRESLYLYVFLTVHILVMPDQACEFLTGS